MHETILWYDKPAGYWEAALPLGNGRMGAMVYGGVRDAEYQLNHDTLWSGPGEYEFNLETPQLVERARALIRAGRYSEAHEFINSNILLSRDECQAYQTAGRLVCQFDLPASEVGNYRRDLCLATGMASTSFTCAGVEYTREAFISHPAQVMCIRLTSSSAGALNFSACMDSPMPYFTPSTPAADTIAYDGRCASMNPSCRCGVNVDDLWAESRRKKRAIRYQNRLTASVLGDLAASSAKDGVLRIENADEVILFIAIATDFCGPATEPGSAGVVAGDKAAEIIRTAQSVGWSSLKAAHIADHSALFDRVEFSLGTSSKHDTPTDIRLESSVSAADDPGLVELLFNYGRYLLIASSRPGCEPANLQGIWNDKINAPWSGRYTININTEMNYWPVNTCNLVECAEPLLSMIGDLSEHGRQTAKALYDCRGWCSHHNTDIWRWSAFVQNDARYAFWPMSGVWLCQHLWQHYLFTLDEGFLKNTALPVLRGAAAFCLDYLVENGDGNLVTCPATSPENVFIDPGTGKPAAASEGCAMDQSLVRELFENILKAVAFSGAEEDSLIREIRDSLPRLAPHTVGSEGQLLEYLAEFEEAEPEHRHVSHLYDVYPGQGFVPGRDDELIDAVRTSLLRRGPKSTGWGMGWRTCLWARLHDGNRAFKVLDNLLTLVEPASTANYANQGGVYRNLFDAHPPFQIDGNFGVTAGIAEMLVQSHHGMIELLPALPDAWPTGEVRGLRARGGFEVDLKWSENKLESVRVRAEKAGKIKVKHAAGIIEVDLRAGESSKFDLI